MKRWITILLALPLLLKAEDVQTQNQIVNSEYSRQKNGDMRKSSASPCKEINPSAWGCPGNEGMFLRADLLYWRASEDDLTFAQVSEATSNPSAPVLANSGYRLAQGAVVPMKTDWDFGFRVGTGWNTNYDAWDVQLMYVWYRNRSTQTVTSTTTGNPVGGLVPSWIAGSTSVNIVIGSSATASWKFRLDDGALELGRAYYTSKSFSTRPFLGVKIDRVDRKTQFIYGQGPAVANQKYININRFMGYGPQIGMGMNFHLPYGLNVMGKAGTAMLFGKGRQRMQTIENNFIIGNARTTGSWKMVPQMQMNLGMSWGMCFSGTTYFELSAAWEGMYFMGIPRNMSPLPGGSAIHGSHEQNLYLNGLNISAKVDF